MKNNDKLLYFATAVDGLETFIFRELNVLEKNNVSFVLALMKNKNASDSNSPKRKWRVVTVSTFNFMCGLVLSIFSMPNRVVSLAIFCIRWKLYREFVASISLWFNLRNTPISKMYSSFGDRKLFVAYLLNRFLFKRRVPLATSIHAHEIYASPNEPFFREVIRQVDKIIAISDKNAAILQEEFAVPSESILVNRLTIDTDQFNIERLHQVITVCRFEERKGLRELLQASKKFIDRANFLIIGWGELDLQQIVLKERLENVTVFDKLTQKQISTMLKNSDIFCLPSKHTEEGGSEGIPIAIVEAMASGLHIVTTDNGSITELVRETIVEQGSVESLVSGLETALTACEKQKINLSNRLIAVEKHGGQNEMAIVKILSEV